MNTVPLFLQQNNEDKMIYYNHNLVDYKKQRTDEEKKVYREITEIKNKYFADNTMGKMVLLYPKGARKEADNGWTQLKKFMLPLRGRDGSWRYSQNIRNVEKKNNQGYADHHKPIINETALTIKDIELIWFLKHASSALGKYLFFEDLEEDAKHEVEEMASDVDIRFMIMSPRSPIAKNEKRMREVASVFGVENVEKIGINQIKKELYDTIKNGEEYGDTFTNFETFDKLVSGETARKAAHIARRAIESNVVGYKTNAWWIMSGRNHEERLISVPAKDGNVRDQVFIQAVVENDNVRSRVFAVMGEDENVTLEDLRAIDRPQLQKRAKELTGQFLNSKKEEIIAELCKHYGINYSPLPE